MSDNNNVSGNAFQAWCFRMAKAFFGLFIIIFIGSFLFLFLVTPHLPGNAPTPAANVTYPYQIETVGPPGTQGAALARWASVLELCPTLRQSQYYILKVVIGPPEFDKYNHPKLAPFSVAMRQFEPFFTSMPSQRRSFYKLPIVDYFLSGNSCIRSPPVGFYERALCPAALPIDMPCP